MKNILLICNSSNNVINFRKELIIQLIEQKYEVSIISSDNNRIKEIENLGAKCFVCKYNNRSTNPFSLLKTINRFTKVIRNVLPDIIFTFQITPNILGNKAARKAKVSNVFSMVEGTGDPFEGDTFIRRIVRFFVCHLYRSAFKKTKKVFFLNKESRDEFIQRHIVKEDQTILIPGIGIDVDNISLSDSVPVEKSIVSLSRLKTGKGIIDYCKIAEEVRKTRKDISFHLYGEEIDITKKELTPFIDNNCIVYKRYTNKPLDVIRNSRLLVLCPYYKEGFPRTILEAMAVGRPTIATNIVGCKDAVVDGQTGYLLEPHDIKGFANKIIEIIDNDKLLLELGKNAREVCEKKFDSKIINSKIIEIISE